MRDVFEGGGLPLIDFTYGVTDWALGPAGNTLEDIAKTGQDALRSGVSLRQVAETILGESPLLKDIGRSFDSSYGEFMNVRNMAFTVASRIESDSRGGSVDAITEGAADALQQRGIVRGAMSLDYDIVAERVARGNAKDAASWMASKLESARDDEHFDEMLDGFSRQVSSRAPLSPIRVADMEEAERRMGPKFFAKAIEVDDQFRDRYAEAIDLALNMLDDKR